MKWLHRMGMRLCALFRKRQLDGELDEELSFHVEQEIQANIQAGMSAEEARYAARRKFGWVESIKERSREQRGIAVIENVLQDVQFGLRMLIKTPGFTAAAVLTLALGIGANTALFSVVDKVLLHPLPLPEPDRLLTVREVDSQEGRAVGVSGPVFQQLLAYTNLFEEIAAFQMGQLALIRQGSPELIWGYEVTPSFFTWLRARPFLGRTFQAGEGAPGQRNAVVLSHGFWKREFGGDPEIVGKPIPLSNEPFSPEPGNEIKSFIVVGVMPPEFQFPNWGVGKCNYWKPLDLAAKTYTKEWDRGPRNWTVLARLQAGVQTAQCTAVLETLAARNAADFPRISKDWRFEVRPLNQLFSTADFRLTVASLAAAIGIVLVLACANVANLLLARAENRHREFAIRAAVGAGRGRLLRQLLTESTLLALLGGLAGVLVAFGGVRVLSAHLSGDLPRLREITCDSRMFGFALLLATVTGILFGLVPAWQLSRLRMNEMLKEAGYGHTSGRERRLFQRGMIVAQIALSLMLLFGAGLMFQSVSRFLKVEPGYDPKHLLLFMVTHFNTSSEERDVKLQQMKEAFQALPGVTAVAISTRGQSESIEVAGRDQPIPAAQWLVSVKGADFFAAWRIPLLRGRTFNPDDAAAGSPGVIINECMAREVWPGEQALGQWFKPAGRAERYQVVGIVRDVVDNPGNCSGLTG